MNLRKILSLGIYIEWIVFKFFRNRLFWSYLNYLVVRERNFVEISRILILKFKKLFIKWECILDVLYI